MKQDHLHGSFVEFIKFHSQAFFRIHRYVAAAIEDDVYFT
jgi:hypothetical protein